MLEAIQSYADGLSTEMNLRGYCLERPSLCFGYLSFGCTYVNPAGTLNFAGSIGADEKEVRSFRVFINTAAEACAATGVAGGYAVMYVTALIFAYGLPQGFRVELAS